MTDLRNRCEQIWYEKREPAKSSTVPYRQVISECPLDQIDDQAVFLRLTTNIILGTAVRLEGSGRPLKNVLPMLDEFVRLGRMGKLVNIANVAAGSGSTSPLIQQVIMQFAVAVNLAAVFPPRPQQLCLPPVLDGPLAQRCFEPGVKPAWVNPEKPAHRPHRKL